jgi:ATP-dependent DNA helicase RecG
LSEGSEKSSEKILRIISQNRSISVNELAEITGISTRAVEKHIANLKEKELLKRIGPDKGGHWEVID